MSRPLPLLLGEMPAKGTDRYGQIFPLSGAVGKRLCIWAGLEPDPDGSKYGRYYWPLRERFDCLNAIHGHQKWDVEVAKKHLNAYFLEYGPPGLVICLGRRPAEAMGLPIRHPWGVWFPSNPGIAQMVNWRITVIPHPSGRNLLYNDPAMVKTAKHVLSQALTVGDQVVATRTPE